MKLLFVFELGCFFQLYVYGKNGLQLLHKQESELRTVRSQVDQIKKSIEHISAEIDEWQRDDFYREKIAREQLQMARKGDKLFYIG